jgi:hypothetical protein
MGGLIGAIEASAVGGRASFAMVSANTYDKVTFSGAEVHGGRLSTRPAWHGRCAVPPIDPLHGDHESYRHELHEHLYAVGQRGWDADRYCTNAKTAAQHP